MFIKHWELNFLFNKSFYEYENLLYLISFWKYTHFIKLKKNKCIYSWKYFVDWLKPHCVCSRRKIFMLTMYVSFSVFLLYEYCILVSLCVSNGWNKMEWGKIFAINIMNIFCLFLLFSLFSFISFHSSFLCMFRFSHL